MTKDLLVLADEYAAATATFARALALKDSADSMSPIAREAGDKRAVLAEALAALDTAQPMQVNAMLVEALKLAVRQNGHDMLMTGEELRKCEKALTAAQQAQPERAPLSVDAYEALVDDLGEWSRYVVEDTAHITLDTHIRRTLAVHGLKQGGQHD